jgi:oxaloacetate decarboxylase gamma subunit
MNADYHSALTLMLVGMITVFVILSLVVISGNVLIRIVNRYFPQPSSPSPTPQADISPAKIAAIATAIDLVSDGKARITSIEKADH